jgi:copper chaperone CopZ
MKTLTLTIGGMSCGHCVAKVGKALGAMPGVVVHSVAVGSASVSYEALTTSPEALVRAVEQLGYTAEMPQVA